MQFVPAPTSHICRNSRDTCTKLFLNAYATIAPTVFLCIAFFARLSIGCSISIPGNELQAGIQPTPYGLIQHTDAHSNLCRPLQILTFQELQCCQRVFEASLDKLLRRKTASYFTSQRRQYSPPVHSIPYLATFHSMLIDSSVCKIVLTWSVPNTGEE